MWTPVNSNDNNIIMTVLRLIEAGEIEEAIDSMKSINAFASYPTIYHAGTTRDPISTRKHYNAFLRALYAEYGYSDAPELVGFNLREQIMPYIYEYVDAHIDAFEGYENAIYEIEQVLLYNDDDDLHSLNLTDAKVYIDYLSSILPYLTHEPDAYSDAVHLLLKLGDIAYNARPAWNKHVYSNNHYPTNNTIPRPPRATN